MATGRFDKAIPPGGEGKIAIMLDPRGCRGGAKKSALVLTNDPVKTYFSLVVMGKLSADF